MTSAAAALAAVADVGLLDPAWAGSRAEAATADRTFLGHLLDVEAAWVRVLARHGLATAAEAEEAAAACDPDAYDVAGLARAAQGGGNPLIPALKALRSRLPAGSRAVHLGATSQDVVDSAMMVMVGRVGAILAEDLAAAQDALAELARTHRSTPMVARSL
ncbi:lyase family protein, partial [Micrococcus sp.]|uniref:lyase family protein n=1 Tax=Micrococcus sp. TaxID=1271 RepID=UPI0026DCD247